jgi:hypothetical protein
MRTTIGMTEDTIDPIATLLHRQCDRTSIIATMIIAVLRLVGARLVGLIQIIVEAVVEVEMTIEGKI